MIKFTHRAAFLSFVLAIVWPNAAIGQHLNSPAKATLIVPDTRLLPGVPFDMWIELRNPSDASISVGLYPHLLVRDEGGESFEVAPRHLPDLLPGQRGTAQDYGAVPGYCILAPGQAATLTLPVPESLTAPEFFADSRLSPPGRYTLAIRLGSYPRSGLETPEIPLTFAGIVTTDEVTIDRVQPTGNDLKVWELMQTMAKGQWAANSWSVNVMTDTVLSQYPDSNYVPYVLLAAGGRDRKSKNLILDAIDRFPDSPVIELLHVTAAELTAGGEDGAVYERELAKVQQSTRPTTRILVFGREDLGKTPAKDNAP